jgi:DNA-binding MarR family transcriptional regulator
MTTNLSPSRLARSLSAASTLSGKRFDASKTLVEVTRLMRAAFDERMQDMGLTGASWRIIFRLAHHDGQTQAGLARRLDITPVAIGEAVDRLEKSGHVERRADPDDRRKRRVHLTEMSIDQLPAMIATAETLQAEIFQDVSEAELAALARTLGKLRARIHETKTEADEEGDA